VPNPIRQHPVGALMVAIAMGVSTATACGTQPKTVDAGSPSQVRPPSDSTEETNPVNPASPAGSKPAVNVPEGPAPAKLVSRDLTVGDGREAIAGSSVTVQYVGVSYSSGKQFDASWDSGSPFDFTLGSGQVIDGWDQGVAGMKVGGRRELIIPPDLAYGERGAGNGLIQPGETLIFVIDLLKVT